MILQHKLSLVVVLVILLHDYGLFVLPFFLHHRTLLLRQHQLSMKVVGDEKIIFDERSRISKRSSIKAPSVPPEIHTEYIGTEKLKPDTDAILNEGEEWEGFMEGFDWQLERARRYLEGPGFAPIRMTLWQPSQLIDRLPSPGPFDQLKILINNALQMLGLAESLDGALSTNCE
jgi:hypothetical protein